VWLVGISEGGAFALHEALDDARVLGVVVMATPPDLRHWARDVLEEARRVGIVADTDYPSDLGAWSRAVTGLDVYRDLGRIGRPVFAVHGADDDVVSVDDVRRYASFDHVEFLVVPAAGHRLRHDPRAVAAVLGWLERQRSVPSEVA
jgi:putative redox protein